MRISIFTNLFNFILFSVLLSAIFLACTDERSGYRIVGSTDLDDGKNIYRIEVNQFNQPSVVDTVTVESGKFEFSGNVDYPDINFLEAEGGVGNVPFVVEKGTIRIQLFKDSLASSKIEGTISNDGLTSYRNDTRGFNKAMGEIAKDMQQAAILNDNILYDDLQEQYKDVQQQIQDYEMGIITSENNSYISALILERVLLAKAISQDSIRSIFDKLTPRIQNSRSGKIVSDALNKPVSSVAIGKEAPMFEAPDPNGNMISLKDKLGKITVVDFWASWCRPCRVENPNLVKMYNKLKPKGLEIVGVSLDKEQAKWLQAIEDDGLNWEHVSHLKFWKDPVAVLYQVTAIPASFVLDSDGVIVAKNLRGQQLEDVVSELLEAD